MQTPAHRRLDSRQRSFDEIPLLDFGPFLTGDDRDSVVREMASVCEDVGFLYIKNHGVPQALIDAAYQQSAALFDLPLAEKMALDLKNSGASLRGYTPFYGENVDPEHTRDYKECFDLADHREQVSPFFGPNQVPASLPEFRVVFAEYHDAMLRLALQLISAIGMGLGLSDDYFATRLRDPMTIQRLLHYPPQAPQAISEGEIGIGAHTDYGFLTILSQDGRGGLQVQNREGEWISAPPVPGTFIVNIGDLVQVLTNDRYLSTLHRVINTSGEERYSMAFFMDLDYDAMVEVLPACQSAQNPARYQPYQCGVHKYQRYVDSYAHLQG